MASQQSQKIEKVLDHEVVFLEQYAWLLDWARQMSRGSKDEAIDLLQEVYVKFVQAKNPVDLTDENKLRGYLYRTLQNTSNSKMHREKRHGLANRSLVEFESAEFALAAVDRSQLLLIRSDLARVCEYVCIRRKSSRAASVLSLRYFFGYFPSEIMALLCCSRDAVDKLTRIAQQEAKVFLTRPGALHFIDVERPRSASPTLHLPDDPSRLFQELRKRLFAEPVGACISDSLMERYSGKTKEPFTTLEIAHLVSCRKCLTEANDLLNFPNLNQRFPPDAIDPRNDISAGPGSGPGSGPDAIISPGLERTLQRNHEHRPLWLQLAVDGDVRASHHISAPTSDFEVTLDPLSRPKYVELLSEQEIVLLYADLADPDIDNPSPRRFEQVLSDGRTIEIEASVSGYGLVVSVSYSDPVFEQERMSLLPEETEFTRFKEMEAANPKEDRVTKTRKDRRRFLSVFDRRNYGATLRWSIATLVLGLALLFLVLTSTKHRSQILPSPTTLLARSRESKSTLVPEHFAMHRTFAFEVRSGKGDLLESGKIDALQSVKPQRSAMKLYRPSGQLLAGRWTDDKGKVTEYARKHLPRRHADQPRDTSTFDAAWINAPDAESFEHLVKAPEYLHVASVPTGYSLSYVADARFAQPHLLAANLVLEKSTMRPVSESFTLQEGAETREYKFQELTYQVLSPNQITESDFAPPPALTRLHPDKASFGSSNDAHAALEALLLLSNMGPEVERSVNLVRTDQGGVELSGVLPTAADKAAVIRVFQPLRAGGQIALDLHAAGDVPEARAVRSSIQVEALEPIPVTDAHVAFDAEVRAVMAAKGLAGPELEQEIQRLAGAALNHGAHLHREGWNIRQIAANDFSRSELQSMQPEDKMLWLTLLDKHLHAFEQDLELFNRMIQPYLIAKTDPSPPSGKTTAVLNDVSELGHTATALNNDSERLDRLLTAGFTLSPSNDSDLPKLSAIAQLSARMQAEERVLQGTIERLQVFGQN